MRKQTIATPSSSAATTQMSFDPRSRPWPIRFANAVGRTIPLSLDPDSLMQTARRRTGLEDFGPFPLEEPLHLLSSAYESESRMNFVGRAAARSYLLRLLESRLRLECDRKKYPEMGQQNIPEPVFVVGLPRTGTTILYNLLELDPDNRAPLSWEVMMPSPPPGLDTTTQPDPRVAETDRLLNRVDRLAPDFKKIHPLGATLPQECIAITTHPLQSIQFHTTHRVPSYQSWLGRQDLRPGYEWHKRFLQHLQWPGGGERWLLKAPGHLFGLDALFAVYPDARVIQTHRDPAKVVASIASHGCVLRAAFSDQIDVSEIGAEWCELWAQGLESAMEYRARTGIDASRILDLQFHEFIDDPMATVGRVYRHFGWKLSDEVDQAMRRHLQDNPKDQHGPHGYSLAQFGLDEVQVRERYADYSDRYDVPVESESVR